MCTASDNYDDCDHADVDHHGDGNDNDDDDADSDIDKASYKEPDVFEVERAVGTRTLKVRINDILSFSMRISLKLVIHRGSYRILNYMERLSKRRCQLGTIL